jgi:hypothetical protein
MINFVERVHRLAESKRRLLHFRLGRRAGEYKGEKRLIGYIVSRPDGDVCEKDLQHYLASRLPDHMIPRNWVFIPSFPITSQGKVDRKALSQLVKPNPGTEAERVLPQNDLERAIANIWEEVLGLSFVGLYDNFFDLGGHSLLLPKLLGKIRTLTQQEISMVDLFQYPTIHALAEYLMQSENGCQKRRERPDVQERIDNGKGRLAQQRARRQAYERQKQEENT